MAEIIPPAIEDNEPVVVDEPVVMDEPQSKEDSQDEQEWTEAFDEAVGKEPEPEAPAEKSEPSDESKQAPEDKPAPGEDGEPESKPEVGPEPEKPQPQPEPQDLESIAARVSSRYSQANVERAKAEIKARIMPELPQIKASDGFVVKSAKDLETIENPQTPGQAFTPEEAQKVFNEYKQGIAQIEAEAEARATKIAQTHQQLEDEATLVMAAFKQVFDANPELQKSMFNAYSKTLKMSEDGTMVEEAPVSLIEFYNSALSPYLKQQQEAAPATPVQPDPVDKVRKQQDRSDVYKPSGNTSVSKDDQEWDEAFKEVLGV